jgi:hypothetical protein
MLNLRSAALLALLFPTVLLAALVLGKYAHDKVRKRIENTAGELAAWESTGQPTEFNAQS